MGTSSSSSANRRLSYDINGEVNFDHFVILRAIGKGSFGKVCIVQKKNTKKLYAMKYMNKRQCAEKSAVENVLSEVDLLRKLDHAFLVNLWFAFQDEEDIFLVVDLLLGGDLRYHMTIQQRVLFTEKHVQLYVCEIGLALGYLRQRKVIHRDIKPDNILLDEEGHVHLTDFNVAVELKNDDDTVTSLAGTKPYMAPEVYACALAESPGYSFGVDWWSLGICAFEVLRGKHHFIEASVDGSHQIPIAQDPCQIQDVQPDNQRPFDVNAGAAANETHNVFLTTHPHYPSAWSDGVKDLLRKLLSVDPDKRLDSLEDLKNHPYMNDLNFDYVLCKQSRPQFIPAKDHLNCDPTYELEEMIIESKPLHKKKKRLAKQSNSKASNDDVKDKDPLYTSLEKISKEFKSYDRQRL